jgi:hypothetical protein
MKPHESQSGHGHLETDPSVVWTLHKSGSPGEQQQRWRLTGGDNDGEYKWSTAILCTWNKKLRVSLFFKRFQMELQN